MLDAVKIEIPFQVAKILNNINISKVIQLTGYFGTTFLIILIAKQFKNSLACFAHKYRAVLLI